MKLNLLKLEVERTFGHQLKEARDFEQLSHLLLSHTRERLSPTTLKRFWGYLKNEEVQTRPHTLDVLAWFVGAKQKLRKVERNAKGKLVFLRRSVTQSCYYSLYNPVTDACYSDQLSESCSLVA